MTIQTGDRMPEGQFHIMTGDGPATLGTGELFGGKKVVLISVPGAFTPTCSSRHLPGLLAQVDAFREKGVDTIACTAVNDLAVMHAWAKDLGVDGRILMLADGNGDYVDACGLSVDSSAFGMGKRGRRFAAIVDDGQIQFLAVDEPGRFEVTSAEALLDALS